MLVVAIIPACRLFEKRWTELPEELACDQRLARAFARDRACLWAAAILLPLAISALLKGLTLLLF